MKILRKFYTSLFLAAALTTSTMALPEGASVQAGSVQVQTSGTTQTITQSSQRAIINWNGFNIDVGELVHFVQPNSISAILNRVVGQDPSQILGSLRANGQVFLINPNGVVFGQTANIDVGSLVVSTLNITDDDFMAGRLEFEQQADKELAGIINHGTIKIDDNGFLVLTGPMVANDGIILAKVGQVALAGGTKSTISFDPTGLIQVELPQGAAVENGIVSVSQGDAGDLLSSVVTTSVQPAGQIVERDGKTFLEVAAGTVVNAGEIAANGQAGEDAGRIVADSTTHTILGASSVLSAAGVGSDSNAGEIYVLSDGSAVSEFGSLLDVSAESGDGGFAEQSSATGFVGTSLNLASADGEFGSFLVDPERVTVQSGAGGGIPPANVVYIPEFTIEALNGGEFDILTQDGVDFEALVGGDLTMLDGTNLHIDLTAGDGADSVTFANPTDTITLAGSGSFIFDSVTGTDIRDLKVNVSDGSITFTAPGSSIVGNSGFSVAGLGSLNFVSIDNVGSAVERVNVDAPLTANATGDIFITNSGAIETRIGAVTANNLDATGQDYRFAGGDQNITNNATFNVTGDLNHTGGFEIIANTGTFTADNIDIRTEVMDLIVTGNNIEVRDLGSINNVTATNTSNTIGNITDINDAGEGSYIFDNMVDDGFGVAEGQIFADAGGIVTYNTVGNKFLDDVGPFGLLSITTTGGDITGNIFAAPNPIALSADSINITSNDFGILAPISLASTVGDVTFVGTSMFNPDVPIFVNSAGDVNITSNGAVGSIIPPMFPMSGLVGNTVTVAGTAIIVDTDATNVIATSTSGDITIAHSGVGATNITADAFGGSGNVNINGVNSGDVNTNNIMGDTVTFSGMLGDVTSNGGTSITGNTQVSISTPGMVNVSTTTDNLFVSAGGSVTVNNMMNSLPTLTANLLAAGNPVSVTTDNALSVTNVLGSDVTFNATDISGMGSMDTLDATASAGNVVFDVSGNTTTVEADATGGNVDIISSNTIQAGATGVNATGSVNLNAGTANLVSVGGGRVRTGAGGQLTARAGLINLLTESENIHAEASASTISINNFNTPDLIALLAADFSVTLNTDGNLNVQKLFSATGGINAIAAGNIVATTNPAGIMLFDMSTPSGNTVAAANGNVFLTGSDIVANVTTSVVVPNALNFDATINATDNSPINVTGTATNGTLTVNNNGSVSGGLTANAVVVNAQDIPALTVNTPSLTVTTAGGAICADAFITSSQITPMDILVNVSGGEIFSLMTAGDVTGTIQDSGTTIIQGTDIDIDIDPINTIDLTATAGNIDVLSTTSNPLNGTASATGTVRIDNAGSVTTTAAGLTGTDVTVIGTVLDIDTDAATVDATSTSGSIDIAHRGNTPTTITADAFGGSGDVTIGGTNSGDVNLNNILGDTVTLNGLLGNVASNGGTSVTGNTRVSISTPGSVNVTTVTDDLFVSAGDAVTVNNTMNSLPTLSANILAAGQTVNLTTSDALDLTFINATSANLSATGINGSGILGGLDATATAGGVIFDLSPGGNTTVVADAQMGSVDLTHDSLLLVGPNDIRATDNVTINSTATVSSSAPGSRIISGAGDTVSIFAALVGVETQTDNLIVESAGSIGVDNFGSADLNALLAATGASGNVDLTTDGDLTVQKLFSANGNVAATSVGALTATTDPSTIMLSDMSTPPGNTVAAPNGMVTLQGSSVTANVTTSNLMVDALNTDAVINLGDSTPVNVTGFATNGSFTLVNDSSVSGSISANAVDLTATDIPSMMVNTPSLDVTTNGVALSDAIFTSTQLGPIDVTVDVANSGTFGLNTTGAVTGTVNNGGTTDITATDINIMVNPTNVLDLIALAGNINVLSSTANALSGTADATGSVTIANSGSFAGGSAALVGSSVVVTASDINTGVFTPNVDAQASSGGVTLDVGGPAVGTTTTVRAVAAAGSDVGITSLANLFITDVTGDNVTITSTGPNIGITGAPNAVTANAININTGPEGTGNGNGVNLQTVSDSITVTSERDVTIFNMSPASDAAFNVITSGDAVSLNTNGILRANVVGSGAVFLTGDVITDMAMRGGTNTIEATSVTATSVAGDVSLSLVGANTELSGSSTGAFSVNSTGNVTIGPPSVTAATTFTGLNSGGGSFTSTGNRIIAPNVIVQSDLIDLDTISANIEAIALTGGARVDNFNSPATNVVIASGGIGDVIFTSDGNATVDRAFAANGNVDINATLDLVAITAPTDPIVGTFSSVSAPGLTLSAPNGSILTGGRSIRANASTSNFTGISTNGNIDLFTDTVGAMGIFAQATNGDANVTGFNADVVGFLDGAIVDVTANTVDADLGASTQSFFASTDGALTARGTSANLGLDLDSDAGDINVSNSGNLLIDLVRADRVTLNAMGDITPRAPGIILADSRAELSGQNVIAAVVSPLVDAVATNGDVNLFLVMEPATVSGSATDLFSVATDTSLQTGQINATTIELNTNAMIIGGGEGGEGGEQGPPPRGEGGPTSITRATGSLVADNIILATDTTNVQTQAATFDVTLTDDGTIANTNRDVTSLMVTSTGGTFNFTNDRSITGVDVTSPDVNISTTMGTVAGSVVATNNAVVQGDSFNIDLTGPSIRATANNGTGTITSNTASLNLDANTTGDLNVTNVGGDISVTRADSNTRVTLDAGTSGDVTRIGGAGGTAIINAPVVEATGLNVILSSSGGSVTANATGGDVTVGGTAPTLQIASTATGNIVASGAGNLVVDQIQGTNVGLLSSGAGNISQRAGTRVVASSLTVVNSDGDIALETEVGSLTASAPSGDININNFSANVNPVDLQASGDLSFTTTGTANIVNFTGVNLALNVAQSVTGSLVGQSVTVTGTDINLDVTANEVNATSTSGDITLTGNNANLQVTANANGGNNNVAIANGGDVALNDIQGNNISVNANGGTGAITQNSGRIQGTSATLDGSTVQVDTTLDSLTVNATGNVAVNNNSASIAPNITTAGNVTFNSTAGDVRAASISGGASAQINASGNIDGSFNAGSVELTGQGISGSVATDTLAANASNGDVNLSSAGTNTLRLNDSSASGDFTLTHGGNVEFTSVTGTNVNIDAVDITDVSGNTIIASGISLNGANIFVNTQGQIITVTASGDVTISNSVVDVDSLSIDSQGNVTFDTSSNLIINQVAGLNGVSIASSGNIGSISGSFVSGPSVSLIAGGSITPDIQNGLEILASNSISIQAAGVSVAASIQGSLPPGAITIITPSGPIYYNGQLLNGAPVPDAPSIPTAPPPEVQDTIGQQSGEVIDDGSVGSAANDGIVEESPTQKLVAQLTEAAEGGGEGGMSTEFLVSLEVDELGEVKVGLTEQSPFDKAIDESDDMTADDVLDLETDELTDVKVSVYYDATNDQIVLAVDLRADDIIDLDVSDYQEIPLNLNYKFLSDPKLTLDKLRLDDIIDLEVEDLGNIPIRVHIDGTNDQSASQ